MNKTCHSGKPPSGGCTGKNNPLFLNISKLYSIFDNIVRLSWSVLPIADFISYDYCIAFMKMLTATNTSVYKTNKWFEYKKLLFQTKLFI